MSRFWLVSLVGFFLVATAAPACKKSTPQEGADAVESGEDKAESSAKKKKKKKKKKKGKGRKTGKDKTAGKGKLDQAKDKTEEKVDKSNPATARPSLVNDTSEARSARPERMAPAGETHNAPSVAQEPGRQPADASGAAGAQPEKAGRKDEDSTSNAERLASRGLSPPPVQVPVTRYLSVADLSQRLTDKGWVSYGPIQGIARAEHYNSVIYRRPSTAAFVSLQVWDFGAYAQALEKWNELLGTSPNASNQKDMFTKLVFFSYRNQVVSLTFVEPDHAMVLSLSCHSETCDDNALYELAKIAYTRAH